MPINSFTDKIRSLITNDLVDSAIEEALDWVNENREQFEHSGHWREFRNVLIVLKRRMKKNKRKITTGDSDSNELRLEENNISNSLLGIIDELEKLISNETYNIPEIEPPIEDTIEDQSDSQKKSKVYYWIVLAVILGSLFGLIFEKNSFVQTSEFKRLLDTIPYLFIQLIKMVVYPLVATTLILSFSKLKAIRKLSKIALKALFIIITTTTLAVTIGITISYLARIGVNKNLESNSTITSASKSTKYISFKEEISRRSTVSNINDSSSIQFILKFQNDADYTLADKYLLSIYLQRKYNYVYLDNKSIVRKNEIIRELDGISDYSEFCDLFSKMQNQKQDDNGKYITLFINFIKEVIPENPFFALASGNLLSIIFISLFLGVTISILPDELTNPFLSVLESINEIIIKMIQLIMRLAPIAIFIITMNLFLNTGSETFNTFGYYVLITLLSILSFIAIVYFSLINLYLKINPFQFIIAIWEALIIGLGTTSSLVSLPTTMEVAQKRLGISRKVSGLIIPIGANINMDGTAIFFAVSLSFIYQYGSGNNALIIDSHIFNIFIAATLASIFSIGIPGGALVTLVLVADVFNIFNILDLTNNKYELALILIFTIDRVLDMFRTSTNIMGDLVISSVIAKSEGEYVRIRFPINKI